MFNFTANTTNKTTTPNTFNQNIGDFTPMMSTATPTSNASKLATTKKPPIPSSAPTTTPKFISETPTAYPSPSTPAGKLFYDPTPDEGNTTTPYEDIDEDKIRRDTIARYQGQIDATKAAYSTLLGQTQVQGQGRLGEGTAQQARGGLLGSDFGQSQMDKTRQLNQGQEQQVLESQATAIANIMAQAEQDARSDISAKRAANQYGYDSRKQYEAEAREIKKENLKKLATTMLLQNVTPTTLGTQLKDLAKKYKVSENDIINAYLTEQSTSQTGSTEFKTIGKDSMLYDPKTGEFITPPGSETTGGPSEYAQERMARTNSSAKSLLESAKANPGIFGKTAALPIPDAVRSEAFRNFESDLQTLKSNIAFNELTAMREASKTGGALGAVSDKETRLLESALGALDMKQSPANIQKNLQLIIESIDRFNQAANQYGGGTSTGSEGGDVFAEEW